jgi:YHS domain-containing protein
MLTEAYATPRRRWSRRLGVLGTVLLLSIALFAYLKSVSPVSWRLWGPTYFGGQSLALDGYDVVAYQKSATAQSGDPRVSYQWGGTEWRFASEENKALFVAEPERYSPQYGGYCAFAVNKGFTAATSPKAWHVHESKLYLFADEKVRDEWVAEIAKGAVERSNANWKKE